MCLINVYLGLFCLPSWKIISRNEAEFEIEAVTNEREGESSGEDKSGSLCGEWFSRSEFFINPGKRTSDQQGECRRKVTESADWRVDVVCRRSMEWNSISSGETSLTPLSSFHSCFCIMVSWSSFASQPQMNPNNETSSLRQTVESKHETFLPKSIIKPVEEHYYIKRWFKRRVSRRNRVHRMIITLNTGRKHEQKKLRQERKRQKHEWRFHMKIVVYARFINFNLCRRLQLLVCSSRFFFRCCQERNATANSKKSKATRFIIQKDLLHRTARNLCEKHELFAQRNPFSSASSFIVSHSGGGSAFVSFILFSLTLCLFLRFHGSPRWERQFARTNFRRLRHSIVFLCDWVTLIMQTVTSS